jgi:hypothetical protein
VSVAPRRGGLYAALPPNAERRLALYAELSRGA